MKTYTRILTRTTALIPATLLATVVSHANPLDGQVVAGSATITTPAPATEVITQQTNSAIINWKAFDIGVGETTQFVLPDSTGVTLNRVVGSQDPSKIMGTLSSNGTVMVVNPDGILFGPHAVVNVGGLLATTSDISDQDFMAKNYQFVKPGKSTASIVNQGTITVKDEGIAALVAPGVRNEGVISAKLGKVTLGAANKFTLDFYGDDLIKLMLDDTLEGDVISTATGKPLADKVANAGTISADGGTVVLKAATARQVVNSVINNTGVIEANSVGLKEGKIVLSAATADTKIASTTTTPTPKQVVKVSGTLSASGKKPKQHGGMIAITGEELQLLSANIIASGDTGGGTILVGGDYLGGKASDQVMASYGITRETTPVPTATNVIVDANTTINADATGTGNGGKVVVWSDGVTATAGTITSRGGAVSGDGGFIETSGKYLNVAKAADASAANGAGGTWLLDPLDIVIKNAPDANLGVGAGVVTGTYNGLVAYPTGAPSVINVADLNTALNLGTNIRISNRGTVGSAPGDISVQSSITKTAGGNAYLVLDSAHDINLASGVGITSTSGALSTMLLATNGQINGSNMGTINLNGGGLSLAASDGITFKTASLAPSSVFITVAPPDAGTPATSTYDMLFGQDKIHFTHDHNTVTIDSHGVILRDPASTAYMQANFGAYNVQLADYAVSIDSHHAWWANIDSTSAFGAMVANTLNRIPEITYDGVLNGVAPSAYSYPGIAPVFETVVQNTTNATNPILCGTLKCFVTGPVGMALINTKLNPSTTLTDAQILAAFGYSGTAASLAAGLSDSAKQCLLDPNSCSGTVQPMTKAAAQALLPYAILANDAAQSPSSIGVFRGFKPVVETWQDILWKNGVPAAEIYFFEQAGFSARVYLNSTTGELVVAFAPSISLLDVSSPQWVKDWIQTNYSQLIGAPSAQYSAAALLANAVQSVFTQATKFTMTGFSKGGGQASYAATASQNVVTFDGARNSASSGGSSTNQINIISTSNNLILPNDIVGNPGTTFGIGGSLPGTSMYVTSTQPNIIGGMILPIGHDIATHSMDGIINGLINVAGGILP